MRLITKFDPVDPKPAVKTERYYNREWRVWVIMLMDEDGNQVGDAAYDIDKNARHPDAPEL
ncbi:hypothetical protein UFOVP820_7 [uncultured Caudovirales phage]|uniref:Uncharacterized protein n=1 Tax=uncultured Caudovirales phage TaxID=2100421 RepID=A0A6J5P7M3_9CAUD|nr:hypothetical protein UFOVP820_7 [uncultured Caudovirales phage]